MVEKRRPSFHDDAARSCIGGDSIGLGIIIPNDSTKEWNGGRESVFVRLAKGLKKKIGGKEKSD